MAALIAAVALIHQSVRSALTGDPYWFQIRFLVGILVLALLLIPLAWPRRPKKILAVFYIVAALLSLGSYSKFGTFHNLWGFLHYWEHFHYQLGSKYFPEVGYDGLYAASVMAQRETHPRQPVQPYIRDLRTSEAYPSHPGNPHLQEVVRRFSEERWRSFVEDHRHFVDSFNYPLGYARLDHGFNPTPTWTFVARLFSAKLPSSRGTLTFLASLDLILLAVAFGMIFRSFGVRIGCLSLVVFGLGFGWAYGWHGGAFLRFSWFAAATLAICMLKGNRPGVAGFLLGYATMVRVFPVLLLIGPAVLALRGILVKEKPRWALRLAAGFAMAVVLGFFAGSMSGRGFKAWPEFLDKMKLHTGTMWSVNRVGLDNTVLYVPPLVTEGIRAGWPVKLRGVPQDEIRRIRERRAVVSWVFKGLFLLMLVAAMWRATLDDSALLGIVAIFILLSPSSYYWVMLALVPLRRGTVPALGIVALSALLNLVALWPADLAFQYALLSIGLLALLLGWIHPDAVRTLKESTKGLHPLVPRGGEDRRPVV